MGAKDFTELRAWQLGRRLKMEVYRFTSLPPAMNDRRFCDDIRAASASVCSNIAEGFGRYTHREFAQFVTMARGSLSETQNHLLDAQDRRYLKPHEFQQMADLAQAAMLALTGLLAYLRGHATPTLKRTDRNRT